MSSSDELWLPRPGESIGRYEVIRQIAKGGMAAVYAVRLPSIGFDQTFAMKVVLPHLRDEAEFNAMFLDEARIAASVHHPNVVQVIEMGTHRGAPFLVMEYLRGRSLSALRKKARAREEALPKKAMLQILAAAAKGLHAAHETKDADGMFMRVVHRDVSPQNIFVGYDGVVKIVDFGVAAARGKLVETQSGQIKGKFQYLAPEQVRRSREPDRRTDIWALGVVAWELVAGRSLFRGDDDASTLFNVVSAEIPSLSDASPAFARLVERCLSRDVINRPEDAASVARELDALAAKAEGADISELMRTWFDDERRADADALKTPVDSKPGVGSDPPTVASPTPMTRKTGKAPLIAVTLVALGLLGAAAFALSRDPEPEREPNESVAEVSRQAEVTMAESEQSQEPDEPSIEDVAPEAPTETRPRPRMRRMRSEMRTETPSQEMPPQPESSPAMMSSTGFGNPYAM